MNLLAPAFLAGLGALVVPLLIHLIRRERHDAVEFPSLMFLSRMPQPTVKRRRIRNWWLFALRCLAIILLVVAFARPFLNDAGSAAALTDASRDVVILVDRSYSMGHGDRWDRAVAAAASEIDALSEDDRGSLVFFDAAARTAVTATGEGARLRAALDTARVGSSVTRYSPALKLAQNILEVSEYTQREVVMISDFQRAGWDGGAGAQLPPGTTMRTVTVGDDVASNVHITHVTLQRARVSGLERVTPTVHVANRSDAPRTVPVSIELDGRATQTVNVQVPAGGTGQAVLDQVTLPDRSVRAVVSAGEDALAADNTFHVLLAPDPGVGVLVVQPARAGGVFLQSALEIAEDPPFETVVKRGVMPTAPELERADVVVLDDVAIPDGDAARRLEAWVEAGGGLVAALGPMSANAGWSEVAAALMGAAPDRVVDRTEGGGAQLGFIDYTHPVFEAFRAQRAGAFGAARVYRYRRLPVPATTDTAVSTAVLARFDDGTPALIERTVGAGRVLVWGSTLDAQWSNLALEPVYLPLVHQMVRRVAGTQLARPWSVAGEVVDVGRTGADALLVNTPTGRRVQVQGSTLLVLDEPGFYEVRQAGAATSGVSAYAVNLDVTESDLAPLDPGEVTRAVVTGGTVQPAETTVTRAPEEMERRQALWWYLLLLVFALLTAEAFLANRRSRRPARTT